MINQKTIPWRLMRIDLATMTLWLKLVTNLIEADLLIILTDVDGLMDADPRTSPMPSGFSGWVNRS
ncbi:MAG: hypothetical protein CM15mP120_28250 [Pseudomonadota bacterium]|nr:MAG: hypothetical protein CM15mP120_28250 [Pseudomonadota bacterium]